MRLTPSDNVSYAALIVFLPFNDVLPVLERADD
jgi:hypothetical protein